MSYLLTIGKKVQQALTRPKPVTNTEIVQPIVLPVYKEPEPEPISLPVYTEPEDDYGASPLTDELIQESLEEQCASLPVLASTTSSHTEESSE